ncbi:MAG: hypothetical protein A3J27_03830 [Candidatus Tectomicrobia bacterium RIFCSPLOWO2_12_FULL_69_37]|nr:MAG: hypothetical protein A3J27_03830 [Candidatus Tectomicrobia bacterium RIFCSPLOWO2_12_FULL_69_37]
MPSHPAAWILLFGALASLVSAQAAWASPAEEIVTVLPRDAIPSIDAPRFVSAQAAGKFMALDEMVIGLEMEDEARAYSVPLLSTHEIVNDRLRGRTIAVTW